MGLTYHPNCDLPPYASIGWSKYALTFHFSVLKVHIMKISISKMQQQVFYFTSQIPHVKFHFLQTVYFCPQIILCNFTSAGVCYQFLNFPERVFTQTFDNNSPLLEHSKEAIWPSLTFSFSIFLRVHVKTDKNSILNDEFELRGSYCYHNIWEPLRCTFPWNHAKKSNVHGWHLSRSIPNYPSN